MKNLANKQTARLAGREGFVMPAVLFVLAILSVMAVGAIWTANDEHRSSRALRESGAALYAAEAGANYVLGTVDGSVFRNIAPGASLDLGWDILPNGATYHAVISRYDTGGQPMFQLTVEGRGAGPWGGQRSISVFLTEGGGIPITSAVRGNAEFEVDDATVSGLDRVPPGWGGACTEPLSDLPGIVWKGDLEVDPDATVTGAPPIVHDPTITSANLFDWGELTYDDLVAMADITLDSEGATIAPSVVGGVCNTADPSNWGAPLAPFSPCFDYFPIIHATDLEIENGGAGQGILLVEGELEIEDLPFDFYGIIINRDELEFEDNINVYGAVIMDGEMEIEDNPQLLYSRCAVQRAQRAHDLLKIVPVGARSWSAAP